MPDIIHEFTPEQLRALQLKSLEMARYFRDFCQQHNLLFYFCGGCCIGALRHKGFIPWDDDVDVFMPREDYEKLKTLWNQYADTSRYSYQITDDDHYTKNLFSTINDNHTTFIKTYQADLDINHGVVLDVLPLDGCPSGKWQRRTQKIWALLYSLFCVQQPPTNHGKKVEWLGKIALGLVPGKKMRCRIRNFSEKQMTKYPISQCEKITELCSGPGYMQNEYPKEAFASAVWKEFEGEMFPIPVGYDAYLRMAFGDYMQLPPKEKQVAHHDVVYCDLDNSYLKYKGIYYPAPKR